MTDVSDHTEWITGHLHAFGRDVGSFIPPVFSRYARVLHPAYRNRSGREPLLVPWREVARASGHEIRSEMKRLDESCKPSQYSSSGELLWDRPPQFGGLPCAEARILAPILARHTRTAEASWFAIWDGFTSPGDSECVGELALAGSRNMRLFRGPLERRLTECRPENPAYRAPNLIWPDDRAWCVATEVDYRWTYVGGSGPCIAEILAERRLETLPTTPSEGNLMDV